MELSATLLAFADGQSVETVWMPEGDGGEAGDGSESGDEELEELDSAPAIAPSTSVELVDPSDSPSSVIPSEAACFIIPSEAEGPAVRRERNVSPSRRTESPRRWQRATICVSSQVGCAVECAFCMTALLGLRRNLTAGEIVGQILAVLSDQQVEMQRDRVNLVFMGQGEPFLNYDNFMQAVRLLVEGVGIPASRMTVSTSGIVPRIADFGSRAGSAQAGRIAQRSQRSVAHAGHADHEEVDDREADRGPARLPAAQPRAADLRVRPAGRRQR